MKSWPLKLNIEKTIVSLGAESEGNFSYYKNGELLLSESFGDLLEQQNLNKFKKELKECIKKKGKPDIILTDLHPDFHTTKLGKDLARKYGSQFSQVQHHLAHIFTSVGEYLTEGNKMPKEFVGIACDGTGYGLDGSIWGGEIFKFPGAKRVGHLEYQTLIGGELAIKEPARMLSSILGKFLPRNKVYEFVSDFYSKNEFELLWNQRKDGFNCLETSSTGRVLDAVSVLLGFTGNERPYKHAPIENLEKNSTEPYELEPVVKNSVIQTTQLFQFLVDNLEKDKKRLAATAQKYLAKGLWTVADRLEGPVFFSGGIAKNEIIGDFLVAKGAIINKKIPSGDAGISLGQILNYCLTDTGN